MHADTKLCACMHTLEDIESGALTGARHVRLCQQGLTEFPRQLFSLADTLEILDLSGNQLHSLPDDLPRLTRLRILFASNNPFSELPRVLGHCPQLEMVGFKSCQISHVPHESLPARLRWLILTDNRITEIPASLGHCQRLQKLMLSCNLLRDLPDLSTCQQLELVRIACNQLSTVPATLLRIPTLAWIALAGNLLTLRSERLTLDARTHPAIPFSTLVIDELLGEGASGHIHHATHKETGQALALKIFKAARTSDGSPLSELAAGLAAGQHPFLLTPLAHVSGHPENKLAMALPLLPPGYVNLAGPPSFESCTRDVYASDTRFTPHTARRLLDCIRGAVDHLHAHGVLHGDLYAHNILWNPQTGDAILSDLGAAVCAHDLPLQLVTSLQAMEWRAFAHLQAEVLMRCKP